MLLIGCAVAVLLMQAAILVLWLRRERSFGRWAERFIAEMRLTRQSNGMVVREMDRVRDDIADDAKLRKDMLDTFIQRSA